MRNWQEIPEATLYTNIYIYSLQIYLCNRITLRTSLAIKVPERIKFQLCDPTYRTAPSYLAGSLHFTLMSRLVVVAASSLLVRSTHHSSVEDRAFPVTARHVCIIGFQGKDSMSRFTRRRKLKTFLLLLTFEHGYCC